MKGKHGKSAVSLAVAVGLICTSLVVPMSANGVQSDAKAKAKAKLKAKSITVKEGKTKTIGLKKKAKKAKYTFKSKNKKIATVSKKGVVKGVKKGNTKVTVTETIKKKKATVGTVTVKVTAAKAAGTSAPATATSAPAATTAATTAAATATPTASPSPSPTPFVINKDDATANITWPELPFKETFDAKAEKDSTIGVKEDGWVAEGGHEGGYGVVKKAYDGPAVFLDNRLGNEEKKYVVSAWIKALSTDDIGKIVQILGGNRYQSKDKTKDNYSEYVASVDEEFVKRRLNSEKWEQIKRVITVPAHKFVEANVICVEADFCIDDLEARELAAGESEEEANKMEEEVPAEKPGEGTALEEAKWPPVPFEENFNDPTECKILYSVDNTAVGTLTFATEGGKNNSGYAIVSGDQHDGAAVYLDNLEFNSVRKFKVSFYVKAHSENSAGQTISFTGSNAWRYFPGYPSESDFETEEEYDAAKEAWEAEEDAGNKVYYSDEERNQYIDSPQYTTFTADEYHRPEDYTDEDGDETETPSARLTNEWKKYTLTLPIGAKKFRELRITTAGPDRKAVQKGEAENYSFGLDNLKVEIVRELEGEGEEEEE